MSQASSPDTNISILLTGHPKCGNVWLFGLLRSLILAAGVTFRQVLEHQPISAAFDLMDLSIEGQSRYDQIHFRPLRAYQTIPNVFYWAIPDIFQFTANTSLVHTHCEWTPETEWLINAFSHHIAIIRDPRDVVLSFSQWMFSPFNRLHRPTRFQSPKDYLDANFRQITKKWLEHQSSWLFRRKSERLLHVVFYEQLVKDTPLHLRIIAEFLGLEVPDQCLNSLCEEHSLENTKKILPHHVWRGGWGNWLEELDEQQVFVIQEMTSGVLKFLGYPLNFEDAYDWRPELLKAPSRPVFKPDL